MSPEQVQQGRKGKSTPTVPTPSTNISEVTDKSEPEAAALEEEEENAGRHINKVVPTTGASTTVKPPGM